MGGEAAKSESAKVEVKSTNDDKKNELVIQLKKIISNFSLNYRMMIVFNFNFSQMKINNFKKS